MGKRRMKSRPGPKNRVPPSRTGSAQDDLAYRRMVRTQARYTQSLKAGMCATRTDGNAKRQVANYMKARTYLQKVEQQVRDILHEHGISTALFSLHIAFGLKVDRMCREHEGETLRVLVNSTLEHWTIQGLDRGVLEAIRDRVAGLGTGAGE